MGIKVVVGLKPSLGVIVEFPSSLPGTFVQVACYFICYHIFIMNFRIAVTIKEAWPWNALAP